MEVRTITLNSEELKYTSKIYSLIGRRFLNKYNVDRFYYHLIGKTEVKEFSERLINKISTRLKVYSVEIKETEYPEDSFQTDADSIRTCQIIIINTEVCKNIYYVINFILYPQSISYNMTTGILLRKTTSENLDDNESQETED